MHEEITAKYTFTEQFGDTTKTTEIATNDLTELFSTVMDWLKYCGISDEMMSEYIDLKKDGFI